MKKTILNTIGLCLIVTTTACAQNNQTEDDPKHLITQALNCNLGSGKTDLIVEKLRSIGAIKNSEEGYTLPLGVLSLHNGAVDEVVVSTDYVDNYIAVLGNSKLEEVAKMANLEKVGATTYSRDTNHGTISASLHDNNVWYSCTVTE